MKTSLVILLACCQICIGAGTVVSYFERLPSQQFMEGSPKQLAKLARDGQGLVDVKNGYMRLDGDGAQVSLQVALFRYADGSPNLIVSWGDLEEPDFTHLTLLREKDGKMVVTARMIFPVPDSKSLRFELPRHGRTVIVRNVAGGVASKWTWSGTEFLKQL